MVAGSTSVTKAPPSSAAPGTLTPVPVCPFSVSVGLVALPPSCGASLRGCTPVLSVCVSDQWLVASASSVDVGPRSAPVAAVTAWSDTRTTSVPGTPLKSAAGTKRKEAPGGSSRALRSPSPLGTAVQPLPVSYSQCPCAAVELSPTTAMPPKAVAALPPPGMALWLSVASLYDAPYSDATVAPLPGWSSTPAAMLPLAAVGRSFTLVTVVVSAMLPALNTLAPPPAPTFTLVPLAGTAVLASPLASVSTSCTVRPVGVPW
ncbi:Uncharacterised protein [Xylophilus ampelinus]|nr:Uncharacterised protein [Xylophilus ampelinus]